MRKGHHSKLISSGGKHPINGPSCLYIAVPLIPTDGKEGDVNGDAVMNWMRVMMEPWLLSRGCLVKGMAIKVKRGKLPALMAQDLKEFQKGAEIRSRFRSWTVKLRGFGFHLSIGRFGNEPVTIEDNVHDEADEPRPRRAAAPDRAAGGKRSAPRSSSIH